MPGTEGEQIASKFGSRDADQVIDALGSLQKMAVERAVEAVEAEKHAPELNPHVTKMLSDVFSQGERLAKILRPALNSASGGAALPVPDQSPQALMAAVVKELEDGGVPRNLITEEMVNSVLQTKAGADRTGAIAAITQGMTP